jgi:hypothetical protein
MHLKIKEILNTSIMFDGYLMPAQRPNAFNNQGNPKYISHVEKNSYAGVKVECIRKSKKC